MQLLASVIASHRDWLAHTMDEVFVYQKGSDDAWLVTVRNDFGEMLHINPEEAKSLYEKYEAPIHKLRCAVQDLRDQGFTLVYSVDLKLKQLAAV